MALDPGVYGSGAATYGMPLAEFSDLADNAFAQQWKQRYQTTRISFLPDIARWIRLLRFFHPRALADHWQDQYGNPLPKLYDSEGLSVTIYNICRPIIEVYGSLLAGQKPLPFNLDSIVMDSTTKSEVFRGGAQDKIMEMEIFNQAIPLHFQDFCTSVMLFGIGWVVSWIDTRTRRLNTQAISWPGDALPQWGSNRYGRRGDSLESLILTERMPIDTAQRLYPGVKFNPAWPDITMRPDSYQQMVLPGGTTQILKVWYRWNEESVTEDDNPTGAPVDIIVSGDEHIGYAEIAYSGTASGEAETLYRKDDTEYPDIPARWASRFQTPGEPPHKAAGALDDVIGINAEYNERLSAMADLLMKAVYPKFKGKNFNPFNTPILNRRQNIIPLGGNQDLTLLQEIAGGTQGMFDSFLGRIEEHMLMNAGLSKIIMGSMPPGETSGEALNNLLHASISRLEVVRTPIQWAWLDLFNEIWVPLLYKFGDYPLPAKPGSKKRTRVDLTEVFNNFHGFAWQWPDVTPRDALRAIQIAMELGRGGYLSDESVMKRASVSNVVDELQKVKTDRQDPILHPDWVRQTAIVDQLRQNMTAGPQGGAAAGGVKVSFSGQLDPMQIADILRVSGIDPNATPGSVMQQQAQTPTGGARPPAKGGDGAPGGDSEAQFAAAKSDQAKGEAGRTPTKTPGDNKPTSVGRGRINAQQGATTIQAAGGPVGPGQAV